LDNDDSAIQRATVNTRHLSAEGLALTYIVKNALRFRPEASYDFIWSSGLFDYLNDKTACFLLRRLKDMLSPGGTIAVGNFGIENPSRSYMEIVGEWFLIHRSPADLVRLAAAAGFKEEELRVEADATGLNLFLIATNGSN
jgi:extracellular factor (EF) 3-hydroxypalmitic acid methyl ester biosynthesis protein